MLASHVAQVFERREQQDIERKKVARRVVLDSAFVDWSGGELTKKQADAFLAACDELAWTEEKIVQSLELVAEVGEQLVFLLGDRQYPVTVGNDLGSCRTNLMALRRRDPLLFAGDDDPPELRLDLTPFNELRVRMRAIADTLPRKTRSFRADDVRMTFVEVANRILNGGEVDECELLLLTEQKLSCGSVDEHSFQLVSLKRELEIACAGDEFDQLSWHNGIRPSVARVRLRGLLEEKPWLSEATVGAV